MFERPLRQLRESCRTAWLLPALLALAAVPSQAGVIDYYRFENNLNDSGSGAHAGSVFSGSPGYSSSAPAATLPQNGLSDAASLSLTAPDSVLFTYAFPFDTLTNATLEFYVNPSSLSQEQDVLWTTSAGGDQNRFNMLITTTGIFSVDYREPGGTIHSIAATGAGAISANAWNFIALVKTGNTYSLYVNSLAPVTNTDASPNLPTSTGWTINGRGPDGLACCQFTGLVDELRLSDSALGSSQFLNSSAAAPEPGVLWLAGAGLSLLGFLRRR